MNIAIRKPQLSKHMSAVNRILVILLGLCAIAYGIASLYEQFFIESSELDVDSIASNLIMILCGLILLKSTKKSARTIIFVAGFCYGLSSVVSELSMLASELAPAVMVTIMMDIIMMLSAVHCYIGDRHSSMRMFSISLIILFLESTLPIMQFATGIDFGDAFWTLLTTFLDIGFLILFMIFLLRPGVREEFIGRRLKRGMVIVESVLSSGSDAFIYRDDVRALVGEDDTKWVLHENDGPIKSHCRVIIYDEHRQFYFIARRWEDGAIRINIEQKLKTHSFGNSFILRGHSFKKQGEKEYLRLYGDDGFFINLLILDRPEKQSILSFLNRPDVDEEGDLLVDTEEVLLNQKFIK